MDENTNAKSHRVLRHARKKEDPKVEEASHFLERAGKALCPFNAEYLGSACVHYFKFPDRVVGIDVTHKYQFATQTLLESVAEGCSDMGLKELRRNMMSSYGREPK